LQEDPVTAPVQNTTYILTASVGKCSATDSVTVKVVPYPVVNAGPDTAICYGTEAFLHSHITGSAFFWTPAGSLLNPRSVSPIAGPQSTTVYILTATDTLGCPKPVSDSIVVTVLPPLQVSAGNDTTIVANQPLQLNARGGLTYTWYPATGMNDSQIKNPVVVLGSSYDSVTYFVRAESAAGCYGTDSVKVKVFKIKPDILIPTAFTPNGDGRNDFFKPILAGIRELIFFRVYNRWAELLYSTSQPGTGWDGTFAGIKQNSGTYVFMVEAVDYLGNRIFKKGTFVLIR
jgi:gliding motility-associated-like protein